MSNIFIQFLQKRKFFLLWLLIIESISSFVYKVFKLEDNLINILLVFVLPSIVFTIVYVEFEKRNKRIEGK